MLEWAKEKVKKGYEKTKTKVGTCLESTKEAMGKIYNAAAEPHKNNFMALYYMIARMKWRGSTNTKFYY